MHYIPLHGPHISGGPVVRPALHEHPRDMGLWITLGMHRVSRVYTCVGGGGEQQGGEEVKDDSVCGCNTWWVQDTQYVGFLASSTTCDPDE